MNLFRVRSLQKKLLLYLLLPITLSLLGSGAVGFYFARKEMLAQWNESSILKLQRTAHDIDMRLEKPFQLIEFFNATGQLNDSAFSQQWVIRQLEAVEGVARVHLRQSARGSSEAGSGRPAMHRMHDAAEGRMHFHSGRISQISVPTYDTESGPRTVSLISSLTDQRGERVGELEVVMRFDYLMADVFELGWWQSELACLVEKNGRYIVHTAAMMIARQRLGETNDPLELDVLAAMESNISGTVSGQGHPPEMVAGFYTLGHAPWTIVLFAPGAEILKPIIRIRNYFFLGSLALVLFILYLMRFNLKRLVTTFNQLSQSANRVSKGEYAKPSIHPSKDEIGQLVESYNSMVDGLKERDYIRNTFGRYIDTEFARELISRPEVASLGGSQREVIILMSDIRGFTPLSESLPPEKIIKILNHYFSHMLAIIKHHRGIIVDFVGDAVLAFFDPLNGPLGPKAQSAVQCAFDMQAEMDIFNKEIGYQGLPRIEMGIGINAGEAVVGNIGSEMRAKYGIVGSAVNLTQRIQDQAAAGVTMISSTLLGHVNDRVDIKYHLDVQLKGIQKPMRLYAVGPCMPQN